VKLAVTSRIEAEQRRPVAQRDAARAEESAAVEAERFEIRARIGALTQRERDVLEGLVAGHPNKIIAFKLEISPRTVEIYRANLMTKMKAGSLSELVRMALVVGPATSSGT
jgi:two-component system, LuxR family, response regulator FixJ